MASNKSDQQGQVGDAAEESHGPQECMPCRGGGQVISNLGGKPATVPCPWCEGTGERVPGVDAQQAWLAQDRDGGVSPADAGEQAA